MSLLTFLVIGGELREYHSQTRISKRYLKYYNVRYHKIVASFNCVCPKSEKRKKEPAALCAGTILWQPNLKGSFLVRFIHGVLSSVDVCLAEKSSADGNVV